MIKLKYRIMMKINNWLGILWPIKICYLGDILIIEFFGKKAGLFLFFDKIIYFIISIIIFYIFYKNDVQLLSEEMVYYLVLYLKLNFIVYIIITIYYYISGLFIVLVLEKDSANFVQGVLNTVKLINMFVNIAIVYWYFELTLELFIQYNIIIIINLLITLIVLFLNIIFKKNINAEKISSFLSYPLIGVIIIWILLWLKKSILHCDVLINNFGVISKNF